MAISTNPKFMRIRSRARILVQVTIKRRLRIGRDGHLDQSEVYENTVQGPYSRTSYDKS